MNKSPRFNGK